MHTSKCGQPCNSMPPCPEEIYIKMNRATIIWVNSSSKYSDLCNKYISSYYDWKNYSYFFFGSPSVLIINIKYIFKKIYKISFKNLFLNFTYNKKIWAYFYLFIYLFLASNSKHEEYFWKFCVIRKNNYNSSVKKYWGNYCHTGLFVLLQF